MFSVDGRFGHSAKNTDGALEKLLMVIPSGDCCRTGLIHVVAFKGLVLLSRILFASYYYGLQLGGHQFLTSIIFASERTLWESGIFSAGVKNAPSPVAGSGVSLPAKDNATTSPPLGRMGVGGVLRVS